MIRSLIRLTLSIALLAGVTATFAPVKAQEAESLTVYSGRAESLMKPIFDRFVEETGVQLNVRYGSTSEMAAAILEEGANSPADVYVSQDGGALGALAKEKRLAVLPSDILARVEAKFRSPEGVWIGLSGRVRILVYSTTRVEPEELPASILELTKPEYKERVGWAPTNASLHTQVTAMRVQLGEDTARQWLTDMLANGTKAYEGNNQVLNAVIAGEIDFGLINHYYLWQLRKQQPDAPAEMHYFPKGDLGSLINVAGAGIVNTSKKPGLAQRLLLYLLGESAQRYFAEQTSEYPLIAGVATSAKLKPLAEIEAPDIDLSKLDDLQGTLALMREVGALP